MLLALVVCAGSDFASLTHATVTEVKGAASGSIVPCALLAPSTPTASFTYANTSDYSLTGMDLSRTVSNAWNSPMRAKRSTPRTVGLSTITLDAFGAKIKLLNMSAPLLQVAVGVMYKVHQDKSKLVCHRVQNAKWDIQVPFHLALGDKLLSPDRPVSVAATHFLTGKPSAATPIMAEQRFECACLLPSRLRHSADTPAPYAYRGLRPPASLSRARSTGRRQRRVSG